MTLVTKFTEWLLNILEREQTDGAPIHTLGVRVDPDTSYDPFDFEGDPTATPDKPDFVRESLRGWEPVRWD